jgi:hypothetical protein
VYVFLAKGRNISLDYVWDRGCKTKNKIILYIMVKLKIENEESGKAGKQGSREAFLAMLKIFSLALGHSLADKLISFLKFF